MTSRHKNEIEKNRCVWQGKKLLKRVYGDLHRRISTLLRSSEDGCPTVEIGSGIGHIKNTIPDCVTTDLTEGPGIDRVEDIYHLSFSDGQVGNLILIHVFHHLRFPGQALKEMHRVLAPGGRVIIFEPYISLLGRLVYGLCHAEPIAFGAPIHWFPESPSRQQPGKEEPTGNHPTTKWGISEAYYAAQGNATRIFARPGFEDYLNDWDVIQCRPISHFSYILSGGYSGPQFYPAFFWPVMKKLDWFASFFPSLFGTSLLVVLEKKDGSTDVQPKN